MTTCAHWREELIDHALDQPVSAALSAHLGTCAGCSATLADWRDRMGRLDAGVRTLAVREPSLELRSRVLAGIDSGPVFFTWRRIRASMVGAMALASFVLITYDASLQKKQRAQSTGIAPAVAALSHWRAPTDVLLYQR